MPATPLAHLGPNWFAVAMGTGIAANAAALLPWQPAGLRAAAVGVWVLAASLLVVLLVATAAHWIRHPANARGHWANPAMAPFYGAPPMALMTVGAGTLLVGRDVIGLHAAVAVDAVLWTVGTLAGLAVAATVPHRTLTRQDRKGDGVQGYWLMAIVPPLVSASTGAPLIAHLPAGPGRLGLLVACYLLFAASLLAATGVIALLCRRLTVYGVGPARLVPTLWIVLGPLGQSVTAAGLLGGAARGVVPGPVHAALTSFGVAFGLLVLGAALGWMALVAAITVRTARADGLPFGLTWWSFTFPVGTTVTGASVLAARTGAVPLDALAVALFALLVAAVVTVLARTAHGTVSGHLLRAPL